MATFSGVTRRVLTTCAALVIGTVGAAVPSTAAPTAPAAAAAPAASTASAAPAGAAPTVPGQGLEWVGSDPLHHVYDPTTPGQTPQYLNDHTVIHGGDGLWHLYSIVGDKVGPGQFPDGNKEIKFAHATAPRLEGPWTTQPYALVVDPSYQGENHLWAPHVVRSGDTYYMFYSGGGPDDRQWALSVATSTDLFHWTRLPSGPVFRDYVGARDPNVTRIGDRWFIYYTANSSTEGGNHVVAYRTSTDLVHWSERATAYTDPTTGANSVSMTESPFVVRHGDWWYLFTGPRGGYVGTDVFRSRDPRHFELADYAGHVPVHAAEVVNDQGQWWVTGAGSFQRGLYLARLHWQPRPPLWQGTRNPAVATNRDGSLTLFALSDKGILRQRTQRSAGGDWGPWTDLDARAGVLPTVASEADGRLSLFSVDRASGHALRRTQRTPGGSLGGWTDLGGELDAAPAVVADTGGRLQAFALAAGGRTLLRAGQRRPGGDWSGWTDFAGPAGSPPAAVANADGRLEVFGVGRAGEYVAHRWQTATGGWSEWTTIGGPAATVTPSVIRGADGRLSVFALAPVGFGLYYRTQAEPGQGWLDWQGLTGSSELTPALAVQPDGQARALVSLPDNLAVREFARTEPTGGWTDRGDLTGRVGCTPALIAGKDGRLSAFTVAEGGAGLRQRTQVTPNGAWGPWRDLGGGRLDGLPCGAAR